MPVNVIGTLKPKNNGKFPVAEAVDIKVTDGLRLDKALENKADLETIEFALNNKADKTTTNSLQSQINELITPVTQDAEVQNARVGYTGKSYSSLKARLDAEEKGNKDYKDLLTELNCGDIFKNNQGVNFTQNGITFAWNGNVCTVSGTSSAATFANFYSNNAGFPSGVHVGDNIIYVNSTDSSNVYVQLYYYEGSTLKIINDIKTTQHFNIPATATGLLMRLYVKSGVTTNATVRVGILNSDSLATLNTNLNNKINNRIYSKSITPYLSDNTLALSDVLVDGFYVIGDGTTITDAPEGTTISALTVQNFQVDHVGKFVKQIAENMTLGKTFYRFSNYLGAFSQWIELASTASMSSYMKSSAFLPSTDLDTVTTNTFRLMTDDATYENAPPVISKGGFMFVMNSSNWILQIWYSLNGNEVYKRRRSNAGVWGEWLSIGTGEQNIYNITNNYPISHYENTYNVTATPSITADTNNYLAPSGDTSDRTIDIVTMLNTVKVCRLGTGTYFIKNLDMPNNSMIIGSGPGTKLRVLGDNGEPTAYGATTGYGIKMLKNCVVKDLMLMGAEGNVTLTDEVRDRHGILWEGNANIQDSTDEFLPERGTVENCIIKHFKGGGITCTNTGYGIGNCLNVNDVYIQNCGAGINVSYWSEFHRFTNCHVMSCYYGCINNGGNNVFVNCCFSSNTMGFLLDNSMGQSTNNAHGSAIGCVFNHSNSNTGYGIKILNCINGFTFVGCQVFYSQIYLEDVSGFNISDSVFGDTNCNITIKNGGTIMFTNNQFRSQPSISITNNDKTHFSNNYVRESGQTVPA